MRKHALVILLAVAGIPLLLAIEAMLARRGRRIRSLGHSRRNPWDAGAPPQRIIIAIDATLIGAHSEKEGAAGNF